MMRCTDDRRLDEARERMWSTPQAVGADEIGVQEEETARIADSLVFSGTGVREIREREHVDDTLTEVQRPGVPPTSETPDRFPPSEWPDDRKQEAVGLVTERPPRPIGRTAPKMCPVCARGFPGWPR